MLSSSTGSVGGRDFKHFSLDDDESFDNQSSLSIICVSNKENSITSK